MRASVLAIALLIGCGGAQTVKAPVDRCERDVVLTTSEDVVAAAGCREITGKLVIRGVGITTLAPLAKLARVNGDVHIAGVFSLDSVSGLDALREVGGNLLVSGNPIATGVFFPALARVGGNAAVRANGAALTVSLHKLERVGGSLAVFSNGSMLRLDLSALRHIGGAFRVHDNAKLDTFAVAPAIRKRVQTIKPR